MSISFEQRLFESVFEHYIYRFAYLENYIQESHKSDIPCYYYRQKEVAETLFFRFDLTLKYDILEFTPSEQKVLKQTLLALQNNTFDFPSFFLSREPRLCFLFQDIRFPHILNPQFLSPVQFDNLLSLTKESSSFFHFYAYQGAIIYLLNQGRHDLDSFFEFCFLVDPENPFLMARYARFLGSMKYKLTRDPLILEKAEQILLKSIDFFGDQVVPFVYGWLGYLYIERKKYDESVSILQKNIELNATYGHEQAESFIWKSLALNKLKKYQESYDICFRIENNRSINDKKDFRFYRLFADICLRLEKYTDFKKYLEICIRLLFLETSIHITHLGHTYTFTNVDMSHRDVYISFFDPLHTNSFSSFLDYNTERITDVYKQMIYILGFFEKEKILGRQTSFKETRNVEILCLEYIIHLYNKY